VDYGYAASTLNVTKSMGANSRIGSNDQFTVQILQGTAVVNTNNVTNSTTTGSGNSIAAGTSGVTPLTQNISYTINEVASGTTNLGQYSGSVSCINTGVGPTAVPSTLGTPFIAQYGDVLNCTLTNVPKAPTLTLRKSMGTATRIDSTNDQFTIAISPEPGGVVARTTTSGNGNAIANGVASGTGAIGIRYKMDEAKGGGASTIQQYNPTLSCSNGLTVANGGTDVSQAVVSQFFGPLKAGDAIDCTITNNIQPAKLTIGQVIASGTPGSNFQFNYSVDNGWGTTALTNPTTGFPGVISDTRAVGVGSATIITVNLLPGWRIIPSTTSCSDKNGGYNSNGSNYFGVISGNTITVPATNVQAFSDLACTVGLQLAPPSINVQKAMGGTGRINAADQFTVQVLQGGTPLVVTGTSTSAGQGSAVSSTTGTTGVTALTAGTAYTVNEVQASGSTSYAGRYSNTLACSNGNTSSTTVLPITLGGAFTPQAGDVITCTLTNTPKVPTITVNKVLTGTGRVNALDQFKMVVFDQSGGLVAFGNTSGATTTATGGVSNYNASIGTKYMYGEEMVGGSASSLSVQYTQSSTCTNALTVANGGTNAAVGMGVMFGPLVAGDVITCAVTNAPAPAKITVLKTTTVGTGTFTYNGTAANANGFKTDSSYQVTTTAANTPAAGSTVTLTATGQVTEIQETVPVNWVLTGASCIDLNAAVTQNTGSIGTLTGSILKILAANIVPGANLQCTFTNAPAPAKVTILKTTTVGTGTFTYNGTAANANGFKTDSSYQVTTTAANTPAAGSTVTLTATGQVTEIQETVPANWVLTGASCTDLNASVTGNNGNIGTLAGSTLKIPLVNIVPGANLQCTFTNAPAPAKITVLKTTTVGTGTFTYNGTAANANGFKTDSSYKVTTTAANTPSAGSTVTLTATGQVTEIQETVPANWVLTGASCTDLNASVTGNNGNIGTLTGSILKIPLVNIVPGANLQCTFTNAPAPAKVTVLKTTTVGTGTFTYNGAAANANGFKTDNSYQVTTTAANTPAAGSTVTLTATGQVTEIQEMVPANWALTGASCTDLNAAVTLNTGNIGALTGSILKIPLVNIVPGANLQCTFTNAPVPTLKITKALGGLGRANAGDQFMVQILQGTTPQSVPGIATSTGGGTMIDSTTGTTGVTPLVAGTLYSINEVASGTTNLSQYTASVGSCINSLSTSTTAIPTTLGTTFALKPGDAIICTLTNTPKTATITLSKSLMASRDHANDQFTVKVTLNGQTVNPTANSTTQGSTNAITPGTGITGSFSIVAGNTYAIDEDFVGPNMNRVHYVSIPTCSSSFYPNGIPGMGSSLGATIVPTAGDAITCLIYNNIYTFANITVKKLLGGTGRVNSTNDQFTVQILQNNLLKNDTTHSTTKGNGAVIETGSGTTGVYSGTPYATYVINEVAASGANLLQYNATMQCVNATVGGTDFSSVTAPGASITPAPADQVTCTITNTPKAATIQVKKALGAGGRINTNSDQFTVQINNADGTGPLASSTTMGSSGNIASGGDTGAFGVTGGTSYNINEVASGIGTNLARYNSTLACSDSAGIQTTGLPTGAPLIVSTGYLLTPVAGAKIVCTITNTPALAKVTVLKTTTVGTGTFTYNGTAANANGFKTDSSYQVTTTAANTPVAGSAVTLTATGQVTEIQETVPVNWVLTGASCIDLNAAVTGNNGNIGTLTGSTLKILAANIVPGANLQCTFTNAPAPAKVTVLKTTTVGTGTFTYNGTPANANGFKTDNSYQVTTTAANTPLAGSAVTLTATGQVTEIQETVPANWVLTGASCIDLNAAVTGNNGNIGTLTGSTLKILAANIVPGANLQCTFTNAPVPTLKITKALGGLGRANAGDQFTVQILQGTTPQSVPGNATSTGGGTMFDSTTGTTGVTPLVAGTLYSINEVGSSGVNLSQYTASVGSCINALSGSTTVIPTTPGSTFSLKPGDAIACTLTNTPKTATITLSKRLLANRDQANDQFTVKVTLNGQTVNPTANSTTQGSTNVISSGSGITGSFSIVAGNTYAIDEDFVGPNVNRVHYTSTPSCTSTAFPGGIIMGSNLGATFVPQAGDAISCVIYNNVYSFANITVKKVLGGTGRVNSDTDQFTVQILQNNLPVNIKTHSTTTGKGALVDSVSGTTGAYSGTPYATYVINEVAAGGANLAQYNATMQCVNATVGGTDFSSVTAPGASITPAPADQVTCTITNTPKAATIQVKKALGVGGRVNTNGDQFTVQINNADGTGPLSSSTTLGSGINIASGGDTGAFGVTVGTSYSINEVASGTGTNLARYNSTLTCSDSAGIQTTGLPNGAPLIVSTGYLLTPVAGAKIVCTITNTAKAPTIQVKKALGTVGRGNAKTDQFTVQSNYAGGTLAQSTTSGVDSNIASGSGDTGAVSAIAGTAYTINEIAATGTGTNLSQYTAVVGCTNNNVAVSGVSKLGDGFTPVAGDVFVCTITNTYTPALATMTVTQRLIVIAPAAFNSPVVFGYTSDNGWGPQQISSPTKVLVIGTTKNIGTLNQAITLSVTLPTEAGWSISSITCTDTNAAVSGNPSITLASSTTTSVTVPFTNIVTNAALQCALIGVRRVQ
jgi:hypothetical protein